MSTKSTFNKPRTGLKNKPFEPLNFCPLSPLNTTLEYFPASILNFSRASNHRILLFMFQAQNPMVTRSTELSQII